MMYTALLLVATAVFASAQVTYDNGTFICPADKPNGAFCGGDSLSSNIIIRCKDGVGQPGNCNDNLAGYFPYGVRSSECWQSSPTSGIAACAKNCVVQGGSGTLNGTLTLPDCTPIPETSTFTSTSVTASGYPTYTPLPTSNGTITITSTGTVTTTCVTDGITTTSTYTFTTTYCPATVTPSTPQFTYAQPSGTGSNPSGYPSSSGNGSSPTVGPPGSATATPVGPASASTSGPVVANGAMINSGSTGACLAAVGLFVAYFL